MVFVWIGLILALLITLAACTVMLARKFVSLLQAFADFVSLPAILDGVHRADPETRPTPAVQLPRESVAAAHRARQQRTRERRQLRREARLSRARALIAIDVNALN